ncbi:hypothetical protein HNP32_001706 [Brevundimonas bullata]|uniref:Uncharacterized protein n=1 Tax=Brevundimonas bullata TaxID=13160 RepID=A0A7W7IPN2_9CAUL|nr:hypothetical protein [Brevundimonas bullata]MBB4797982.1 hypothetical protein [Brevundimonas bullata]MBB6382941.1 hypothetical protein [Brevundimonas bullata]
MNRKLLMREARSLAHRIAQLKPFDWVASGAFVIILSWPKKLIWRPWPDWLVATAMGIGGALVAYGALLWLLSLRAAKVNASGEG